MPKSPFTPTNCRITWRLGCGTTITQGFLIGVNRWNKAAIIGLIWATPMVLTWIYASATGNGGPKGAVFVEADEGTAIVYEARTDDASEHDFIAYDGKPVPIEHDPTQIFLERLFGS